MERASPNSSREAAILEAATASMLRHGFDRLTMRELAAEAGIGRGVLYLHFSGKEQVLGAVLDREVLAYAQAWHDEIVADPSINSIGDIYRAVARAIAGRPLLAAMLRRDRQIFGDYLRRPDSRFAALRENSFGLDAIRMMQEAGAVRREVDPRVVSYVMDLFSYGLASSEALWDPDTVPPFPQVMDTIATMIDRLLIPDDGGNPEAGRAIILELVGVVQQHLTASRTAIER